jgi:hypothetical protein
MHERNGNSRKCRRNHLALEFVLVAFSPNNSAADNLDHDWLKCGRLD